MNGYSFSLFNLGQGRVTAKRRKAIDVLRIAFSRLIITKDRGASLARDVSHSRPHKVAQFNDFEVFLEFDRVVRQLRKALLEAPPPGNVDVRVGDARSLKKVSNASVDAVFTSPPYLNAIDYMRGHRLSLVWLGHSLGELRSIRSSSIGAERGPDSPLNKSLFDEICRSMCAGDQVSSRHLLMISRYAEDVYRLMSETARVLKHDARAILVVGNSCLKGTFVRNSNGVSMAASMVGLRLVAETERELPSNHRYLPMPASAGSPLGKRMRTETILTFEKARS